MDLSERQRDAVSELINIAFSRTGAALSELSGQRVILSAPEVSIHPTAELPGALAKFIPGEVASIHQVFGGPVAGDALLLLNQEGAVQLTDLLTADGHAPSNRLDESAREVLTEVGNVILSSCLSAFGDMLRVSVTFAVPRIHVESLDGLLRSLKVKDDEMHYTLLAATRFRLSEGEVGGYLMIAVGIASLELITRALAAREG